MRLYFKDDISDLEDGIKIFSKELDFEISSDGLCVTIEKNCSNKLEVEKRGNAAVISYSKKIQFFRGLGLLVEAIRERDEFKITEEPQFDMSGTMFDVSQGNAVMNFGSIKRIVTKMALMGLNMFMLYTEDSYEIEGEQYFGYMRGKYTYNELKECDDYADMFGIEVIPCIQTLAHLIDVLKWENYSKIKDNEDILLAGYDKTYEFIEKMIAAAAAPFRTKRIHIGMDEALNLGLGRYVSLYGYKRKFDIMADHLEKVLHITTKYGLKPIIWSDMYFRAGSKTGDYYDMESVIPQDVIDKIPHDIKLVYWDYYHDDEEFYTEWIKRHRALGSEPIFAGGIWSWKGFCVNYGKTFITTNAALAACKKQGIKEIFSTIWGDGGTESIVFSNLLGLQLFAEHSYSKELDIEKLKKRFKFCTGADYEDFMDLRYLDEIPASTTHNLDVNPSKYILWQDILMGLFDKNIEGLNLKEHYRWLQERMKSHAVANSEFNFIFELIEKLCSVLTLKAEMGLKLADSYQAKDLSTLKEIADNELSELLKRVDLLRICHREQWYRINKPFGWEVLDIRYGGLLARIQSTKDRVKDFLEGKIDKIEELDEKRLYFSNAPGLLNCNVYNRMPTASRLSM